MSRRRSRFTVTIREADAQRLVVIMAYNATGAHAYCAAQGWEVVSIRKGDYRNRPRAGTGARPLPAAVVQASAMLGLVHPVKVRVSNRNGGVSGLHSAVPTGGSVIRRGSSFMLVDTATGWCHEIMVKGYLSAEDMGRALWHELAHALQFERDALSLGLVPSETMQRWHASYSDGTSYNLKPAEVEAREHEPLNDDLPLAR